MRILKEFVQNPEICLREVMKGKKLSYACFGYALGIISLYFSIKLGRQNIASLSGFFFAFIFWFTANVILNFVLAALCNILLEMTENKASALDIFILLGFSQIIWIFLIPCFLIFRALPQIYPLMPLIVLAIIAGQIFFVLTFIKKIFGIPRTASLVAFVGSFILPFAAWFLFFCCMIGFIVALAA